MVLYHVSNRLYTQPHLFIPRIPDRTMGHEDMRHPQCAA